MDNNPWLQIPTKDKYMTQLKHLHVYLNTEQVKKWIISGNLTISVTKCPLPGLQAFVLCSEGYNTCYEMDTKKYAFTYYHVSIKMLWITITFWSGTELMLILIITRYCGSIMWYKKIIMNWLFSECDRTQHVTSVTHLNKYSFCNTFSQKLYLFCSGM